MAKFELWSHGWNTNIVSACARDHIHTYIRISHILAAANNALLDINQDLCNDPAIKYLCVLPSR